MATVADQKSGSQNEADKSSILEQAVQHGCEILEELLDCQDGNDSEEECPTRSPHFPQFLPRARALVFLKGLKMGALMAGVQGASGFIIRKIRIEEQQPASPPSPHLPPTPASPGGRTVWSAPCFVKAAGVQVGVVGGLEQVHTLLGVLSDEALKGLMQCRKATLGAGWGVALWPLGADNWEVPLTSDLAVARVGRGVMVDIGLQSSIIMVDHARNEACYGSCASPTAILGGTVPPPAAMHPLLAKLRECTCAAVAASFEPAWHRHRNT